MDHSFQPSIADITKCARCKYPSIQHGSEATCEACPNIGIVRPVFGGILMCEECITKETQLTLANMTPIAQDNRVNSMNIALETARLVDASITVKTDIFNAETTSIIELKSVIDTDTNIVNKPYALAEILTQRFQHFKQIVFDKTAEIIEAGNAQKAIQVYLNELSNKLRSEERERLKIADINYKPPVVKPISPKAIKTKSAGKMDKVALRKYAIELGVQESTLQMIVVSKGITVESAANLLRRSINEAKEMK